MGRAAGGVNDAARARQREDAAAHAPCRIGYTAAMSEARSASDDDDPATLARRFLDLWQEEVAGTGRDEGPGPLASRLAALHLGAMAGARGRRPE